MFEVFDYSSRRGAIVPLLADIYKIICETKIKNPENIIFFKQRMSKLLIDINYRWIILNEKKSLAGFLFYRYENETIHITDLHISKTVNSPKEAITLILKKMEYDQGTKTASFYENEFLLGDFKSMSDTLTLRYSK